MKVRLFPALVALALLLPLSGANPADVTIRMETGDNGVPSGLSGNIWIGGGAGAGGHAVAFYVERDVDLDDLPVVPPVAEEALRTVSDFGITYYNPALDAVTFETHGVLHSAIDCPGGWQTTTQTVSGLPTSSLTYNVWYNPARLQVISNEGGTATVTTGTCTEPVLYTYGAQDAVDAPVEGCFASATGTPTPNPTVPYPTWVEGPRSNQTVYGKDPKKGDPSLFKLEHAKIRYCWSVATLDGSNGVSTTAGIPFTGTVWGNYPGYNCHSWDFLAGKRWIYTGQPGCNSYQVSTTWAQDLTLFSNGWTVGTALTFAVAGTYAIWIEECDACGS